MKIRKIIFPLIIIVSFAGFTSCNNTKYLPANESLYTGATVKVDAPHLRKKQKKLSTKN